MTQLLLDTQIFIWYLTDDSKLSSALSNHVENPENELFLSIASLWEIAVKINIGKLRLGCPFSELFTFSDRVSVSERESHWYYPVIDNPSGCKLYILRKSRAIAFQFDEGRSLWG